MGTRAARVFAAALGLFATPSFAQDSALDRLGKAAGLMAPPADPPDFVKASRPAAEPTSIPVFSTPPEPRSHVKTPAELGAMDADLQRAARRQPVAAPTKSPRKKTGSR